MNIRDYTFTLVNKPEFPPPPKDAKAFREAINAGQD
jgi:hypothetical protein